MNVMMWEHCIPNKFLDVANFNLITNKKLLIPAVGLEMSSLPAFAFKYLNKIFTWYSGN
jgi:hypothetical protein